MVCLTIIPQTLIEYDTVAKSRVKYNEQGRRLLYIFPSKEGDYSREVINRGTAIIGGNTVPSTRGSFEIQEGQL